MNHFGFNDTDNDTGMSEWKCAAPKAPPISLELLRNFAQWSANQRTNGTRSIPSPPPSDTPPSRAPLSGQSEATP